MLSQVLDPSTALAVAGVTTADLADCVQMNNNRVIVESL